MRSAFVLLTAAIAVTLGLSTATPAPVPATQPKNKRLLLVTHSGGFIHGSVATAEQVLKEIGPKNGFDVTCYRFTEDPDKKVKGKNGKERTALEAYSDRFRALNPVDRREGELRTDQQGHAEKLRRGAVLHHWQPTHP